MFSVHIYLEEWRITYNWSPMYILVTPEILLWLVHQYCSCGAYGSPLDYILVGETEKKNIALVMNCFVLFIVQAQSHFLFIYVLEGSAVTISPLLT